MIEATCGACGTLNRVADSDVAGRREVHHVHELQVARSDSDEDASRRPEDPEDSSRDSEGSGSDEQERRHRSRRSAGAEARHAARSGAVATGAALGTARPRKKSPTCLRRSFARPTRLRSNLDDLMGPGGDDEPEPPRRDLADLPAPKHAVAPPIPRRVVGDLPAPKRSGSEGGPRGPVRGEVDLPAPKATGNVMDLPAPKGVLRPARAEARVRGSARAQGSAPPIWHQSTAA